MSPRAPSFSLYLITDRRLCAARHGSLAEVVEGVCAALPPGAVAVQLREKDLDGRELLALAQALRLVTRRHGALLLVNDRVDVALAAGADGVHLPQDGLSPAQVRALWPVALIGVSTHGAVQAEAAVRAGASFLVLGPVYDTPSKRPFGAPLGEDGLRATLLGLRATSSRVPPVYALGGVDATHARAVREAGATGVACISAVLGAAEPATAARGLVEAFGEPRESLV